MTIAACQKDSYLRTLRTTVVECLPWADGYAVVLADTILYAEGGGQPADRGSLEGGSGAMLVRDVQKRDSRWLHMSEGPVAVGEEVVVTLDWGRRWDHMQQHSAQHLLTAVAHDTFGYPTVAFHLGEQTCTIDVDGVIGDEELTAITARVNDEIRAARPIQTRLVAPDALSDLDVRSRGLPEDHEGDVRLVEIEGIDLNTCGGTHVANTIELQALCVVGTEKVRGGTRIHYLAGARAVDRLLTAVAQQAAATRLLSCGPAEHVGKVKKLMNDLREAQKARQRLEDEVAAALAESIASRGELTYHRESGDMAFLAKMVGHLRKIRPSETYLLTASESGHGPGVFVICGPPDHVSSVGPHVAEILGGRGGGRGERYQGKVEHVERIGEAGAFLVESSRM